MNDRLPRLDRGCGVIGMLTALASLATLAALIARMPITPGPSRPTVAVPPTAPHASAGRPAQTVSPRPNQTALPRSKPARVSIPAIDAESSLMPLRLNPDRTVQVPPLSNPMQAGWYSLGPTPGEVGSSVILGHVDGYSEPGIFFRLRELQPGDRVLVTREDGLTARFVVYHTEQAPKSDFPTDKVYGATARPELRLITCGGSFDRQSGNYRDNVIVFAVLT
jgi:sortase (surface protein transpeptidase)